MKIVVTGGSGKAGAAVVENLLTRGHDVINVDQAASLDPDAPTLVANLTDFGQTVEALSGADAVAHLAAIPAPNMLSNGETFRINTMSTYNVFSASAIVGVKRVVWASSETLIGIPFERERPRYAPIDEEHPRLPEFHYALAKLVGEEMATQFHRWTGIPFVSLRYSNVMLESDYVRFPGFWSDPYLRSWNLWGYVDARDVAQATRLALESEVGGAEAFLVAAGDTCMDRPSSELMSAVFPDVPMKRPVEGFETLLSIEKARSVLGYEPRHSWREYQ